MSAPGRAARLWGNVAAMPAARALRAAALALCLSLLLASIPACSPGTRQPAESAAGSSMMARVPRECASGGCVFLDTADMRDNLDGLYATYRESFSALEDYGVSFDDIDRLASAGLSLLVLEGQFDADRIREELGIRGYGRTTYLGVEVWERSAADSADWVSLPEPLIVAGCRDSVIDCLEVIVEDEDSLHSHTDVAGVAGRLPGGVDMCVAAMALQGPLLAHGESLQRIDGQTLRLTLVHKYVDAAAAAGAAATIATDTQEMLSQALRAVQVRREGQFVTLTAEVAPDVICARMTSE